MRAASYLSLGRAPGTEAAHHVVAHVLDAITPFLAGKRTLGPGKVATIRQDLGVILGGIIGPGLNGSPVRAQRGLNGSMWSGAIPGARAFWRIADAMIAAGLLGYREGTQGPAMTNRGLASVLWAAAPLLSLAADHGITAATVRRHWRPDRTAAATPPKLAGGSVVTCRALPGVSGDRRDDAALDAIGDPVRALNAAIAAVDVRGCPGIALQRRFLHASTFGGRHYAVGAGTYQTMSAVERLRITLNGEAVCEVDVHASQLTILLALAGRRALPGGDLYGRAHPNRAAAKACVVQWLGAGRPLTRWGANTATETRAAKLRDVRAAVLATYPELGDLAAAMPAGVLDILPVERRPWGIGQHLAAREAGIIAAALATCLAAGVPALPVHDSLIVPRSCEHVARQALKNAYGAALGGVVPRLKVDAAPDVALAA